MSAKSAKTKTASIFAAAFTGAALSIVATLLATGFFRQRDLARTVADLESRASTAEELARNESNRTRRAREQAVELIDFFVDGMREELEPIGRTDIIEYDARQAEIYFENLPPDAIDASSDYHHAKMLIARAQAHYDQGALPESKVAFEKALALLEPIATTSDDKFVPNLLAASHNQLALTLSQAGEFETACSHNEAALAILQQLDREDPDNRDWVHGVAAAQLGIAETLRRAERLDEALPYYDLAIEDAKRAIALDQDQTDVHHLATLMFAHTNKGYCLTQDDDFAGAEAEINQSTEIAEQLIELEPTRKKWKKEYATLINNFGSMLDDQGQTERANELIEKARGLRKELINFDPANSNWRYDLANSEYNLAMNYLERADIEQAWAAAQQYLGHTSAMLRNSPGNEVWHNDLDTYIDHLTDRFGELDADSKAAQVFESVERLYRELADADPDNELHKLRRADALFHAGESRKRSRDYESSLAHQAAALQLRLELFQADQMNIDRRYELASCIGNYGHALQNLERNTEALKHFQFAYATYLDVPAGHRSRDIYLKLDEKNIRHIRARLGLIKEPPSLIKPSSDWQYWDAGEAPAPGWQNPEFHDAAWNSGPGQLGYGEGDERTKISFGSDKDNKHPSAYFRHSFDVAEADTSSTIHINLIRDDGAIVYLNGEEVARDLMPEGDAGFGTYATDFVPNNIENQPVWFDLPEQAKLRPGKNVVAVEIHQSDAASSDLSFDLALFKNALQLDPLEGMDRAAYKKLLATPLH